MIGELVLEDEDSLFGDDFSILPSAYGFGLSVHVDEEHPIERQIKNREEFDKCMAFSRQVRLDMGEVNQQTEEAIQYIENNFENIFDSIEYIRLALSNENPKEFIKKNPIVLSKKIVLNEYLTIVDYDRLLELMDEYKDIEDNVYVGLEGNTGYVKLEDCLKTMSAIKKQAESIKSLGLSQMETIMYVYDYVRNRVYQYEDETETEFKSRDLSEVMFGDKIVCSGYANIFHAMLYYLGIDSQLIVLDDRKDPENKAGHARNAIYIKDPKYDIDGVYYFDVTWDSKVAERDNSYLYRYNFFAKTKRFMDDDKHYDLKDTFLPEYSDDIYEKIEKIILDGNYEALKPYSKTINHMSRLIGEPGMIDVIYIIPQLPTYGKFDHEQFLKKFKYVCSKFNKELSAEVMIQVLNNVRKLEYYQYPDWYLYSIDDMYRTFLTSNWEFKDRHVDRAEKLLQVIFDKEENSPISRLDNFRNYAHEIGLFKSIEQVRVTNTLRQIRDKKLKSK